MIKDGHEVTVLCASGGYATGEKLKTEKLKAEIGEEGRDGEKLKNEAPGSEEAANCDPRTANSQAVILRIGATRFGRGSFLGKLVDYASYYLGVIWKLATMETRPDRIIALTTPPFLSVVARALSKIRGGQHAHWVMDLYPDVMVAHGMLGGGGLSHWGLASQARWGFGGTRCSGIVTLGPDMAARIEGLMAQGGGGEPRPAVEWVPLWGTGGKAFGSEETQKVSGARMLRRERGWADDELVVMYSGNMGLGHRFGEFLMAAKSLAKERRSEFRFEFFGDGKRRDEIKEFTASHPHCRIEVHGYAPAESLGDHLRSADVHLVSLEPSWTGTMIPSKLQGIFAEGRPAIFVGAAESSIARWVIESGGKKFASAE